MLDKGWSHTMITSTLSIFSVFFVAAAYYFRDYGCTLLILAGIVIFFAGIAALYYTSAHPGIFVSQPSELVTIEDGEANVTKIVPINKEVLLEKENG
jgi:hypothetical protein